jgi:hypothetical protein
MELKIEGNCYTHNLIFAYDQVVITTGAEDSKLQGKKIGQI